MAKERLPISCPPAPKEFKFKYKDKDGKDQEGTAKYPPELNQWFESVRTMLDVAYGVRREAEALRFVTLQELVNTGMMQASLANGTKLKKADNVTGSLEIDLPNVSVDDRIPDLPTNFAATATFRSIILTWDLPSYPNHDYTEVWRNTTNNLSTATLHMSVGSGVASDAVGTSATYYYWLRNVGTNGKRSSYTNVVSGTTTTLPGTEITSIAATKVTAGTLAADVILSSSIAAGQITAGTIGAHTIELNGASSVLQSTDYRTSGGTTGWKIGGDGNAYFDCVSLRGTLNADRIDARTIVSSKIGNNAVHDLWISSYGGDKSDGVGYKNTDMTNTTSFLSGGGGNVVAVVDTGVYTTPTGDAEPLWEFELVVQIYNPDAANQLAGCKIYTSTSNYSIGDAIAASFHTVPLRLVCVNGAAQTFVVKSYYKKGWSSNDPNANRYKIFWVGRHVTTVAWEVWRTVATVRLLKK